MPETTSTAALVVQRRTPDTLVAQLSGDWRAQDSLPGLEPIQEALSDGATVKVLEFDTSGLGEWDSRFVAFITKCYDLCQQRKLEFRTGGLPEGVRGLLRLANA